MDRAQSVALNNNAEPYGLSLIALAGGGLLHGLMFREQMFLPYLAAVILVVCKAGARAATLTAVLGAAATLATYLTVDRDLLSPVQFLSAFCLYAGVSALLIHWRRQSQLERQRLLREGEAAARARFEADLGQAVLQARIAAISQLGSSIAHDLRNPLGVIRNAAYLLRRRLAKLDVKIDLLNMIEDEVKTADALIASLAESASARSPETSEVDLGGLLEELARRIDSTGRVRWRIETTPTPFIVCGDPSQLRQVMGALLQNAVEAMKGAGLVCVKGYRENGVDHIEVRDEGPGISPEVRPTLFEPLTTTKRTGAGLGLMTCRQIVERHGGSITVIDDDTPGAKFRVSLPRKTVLSPMAAAS